jgi:hypothetical protein
LGTDVQLAQAMIDGTSGALATGATWATFALLPLLVVVAAVWAGAMERMHVPWPVQMAWPGTVPNNYVGLIEAMSIAVLACRVLRTRLMPIHW